MRTKAVKSAVESDDDDAISTGIEGMYLKLGKRNAEAVEEELAAGAMDEFVTRILLKG